jgi:hypothetical protein
MDTIEIRTKRNSQLNEFQKSVIIGCILGDGYLLKTTRGFCLRINHSLKQKALVDWKYTALKEISTPPKVYKNSYYFRTVSHPIMLYYRKLFYRGKCKVIPRELAVHMNSVVLAVWIMDDGTNELGHSKCLRINTQCFSLEDQLRLIQILREKFGIITTLNRDKDRFRLRVKKESMEKLISLIKPYIIKEMYYKIAP